eukprot:g13183.t1
MFFAYGMEEETTEHFLREAFTSARRIKLLNPNTNITLVTNPGLKPDIAGAFDLVINVEQEHLLPGEVPSWTPQGLKRQWLTRLEYLSRSPYEVTLALDSQALCCAAGVEAILKQGLEEFDVAFAVQGPRLLTPHNWAIMYRLNSNTARLFNRWKLLHIAKSRTGSDQTTLHLAAGSLALQGKLNVGVLAESVALATVPYNHDGPAWPRSSPLLEPGPVHFVHYNAYTQDEEETTCERLNREPNRARVVFQAAAMPRSEETNIRTENTWEMKYSEDELAEAARTVREDALYFRGLDWENASSKWGHVATPWREHYPDCWDDLFKEIDSGIRRVVDKKSIRTHAAFIAEFGDDSLWPIQP